MHVPQLGQSQCLVAGPVASTHCVLVDPLGGRGVGMDLQVLPQLPAADGTPLLEKRSNLPEDERVAFDRRRVVGLLVPDSAPDRLGGMRQTTDTLEVCQAFVHGGIEHRSSRPSTTRWLLVHGILTARG